MAREGAGGALEVIFAIFLGMMVSAFVGVGTYTFYAPPDDRFDAEIRDLTSQQQNDGVARSSTQSMLEGRSRLRALTEEISEVQSDKRAARRRWGRNLSLILLGFSTLLMAISLTRADQLPVISDGLLIGGVFLMIYAIGWIVATNTTLARFLVISMALAITLALGYVRFVRVQPTLQVRGTTAEARLQQLERHVHILEERLDDTTHGPMMT